MSILGKSSLSTILKEGTVVNTKLSPGNIWHQNIVYKVEDNYVSVALITDYLENIIMPGQKMSIKLTNKDMEFLFTGTVTKIQPQFPSYVTINVKTLKDMKNSSVFPRYDVYLAANIESNNSKDKHFAIIHNISLIGMAFYSKNDFSISDEQLNLTIYLPNKDIITAKGTITRKISSDSYIDYGLKYTDMQEDINNSLYSFFSELEDEKSRLKDIFFKSIKKHLT